MVQGIYVSKCYFGRNYAVKWNFFILVYKRVTRDAELLGYVLYKYNLPILTGNPEGNCSVINSLSFLKCELFKAIRSTIGETCSCKRSGYVSQSESVALNVWTFCVSSIPRIVPFK
jgi:hypothetical protein